MTDARGDGPGESAVDADYLANLDALSRDVADIEAVAAAALEDGPLPHAIAEREDRPGNFTYDELTAHNARRRSAKGWGEVDLDRLLDPAARRRLEEWRNAARLPWERADIVVVGVAGLIGAIANLYDDHVDAGVLRGLSWLKRSELLQQWEKDAARLAIDYTGPHFGGPAHRLRSAGHDIGRFFAALEQVRNGTFEGVRWEDGIKIVEQVTTTRSGLPFVSASEPSLAVALLLKHWAADFVTPMSLPLPGWSLLYEMPDRDLRTFAHQAYAGSNVGDGLNLRSGVLTPGLGMVAAELIVRTQTHLAAYRRTGRPSLDTAGAAKRNEMLLSAHAAAGAVSVSATVAAAAAGDALGAVGSLNLPVLVRIGMLAISVRADAARRAEASAPSWDQLLEAEAATWTLPEALTIADLLETQV